MAEQLAGRVTVGVVEDEGKVVAHGVLCTLLHGEEVWVAESHRGRGGALSPLLRLLSREAREYGCDAVIVSTTDAGVEKRFQAQGGKPWPGVTYQLPVIPAQE